MCILPLRYSGLTVSCLARGKSLKAALEQLNNFDRQIFSSKYQQKNSLPIHTNRELAEFLAFLGEEEASLEKLEAGEVRRNFEDPT